MGLRVVVVAVLMLAVGCGDGARDNAAVEPTPGATASSLAPPSTTSTSSTSVAPWRTSVPPEEMACVPEPADYVDPHMTAEVQRPVLGVSPTYELAVWDPVTLEESATRPISGRATLLDTGEVVVQRALVEGTVPEEQPFTTEMMPYDVATGEETLVATFDDYLVHRDTWPTARPQAVVDDALIVGAAVYPLP